MANGPAEGLIGIRAEPYLPVTRPPKKYLQGERDSATLTRRSRQSGGIGRVSLPISSTYQKGALNPQGDAGLGNRPQEVQNLAKYYILKLAEDGSIEVKPLKDECLADEVDLINVEDWWNQN